MEKVEFLILRNLLHNEEYLRKVIPFIKSEYFEDNHQKIIFEEIQNFVEKYNQIATKEVLCIEVENRSDINDSSFKEVVGIITSLEDELSEVENETALMNVDALKSVTADGEGKIITRLSSMYRRQLALSARVALPDGQILPSIFFTI